MRRWFSCLWLVPFFAAASAVFAAGTITFTPDGSGTHPNALRLDTKTQVLTIDLSALPVDATIFRAELILRRPRNDSRPVRPTRVYVDGQPDKPLGFIAPRFAGLDALAPVQAAVREKRPLKLKVENTAAGIARLEVSFLEAKIKVPHSVGEVKAIHRAGQTFVTFSEPRLVEFPDFKTGEDVKRFEKEVLAAHPGLSFRIWRSLEPITPATFARAQFVGECGLLTAWNATYHQDDTAKKPPIRYTLTDLGQPLPWGDGVYAHNPTEGNAFYAVTVAVDGQEDLDSAVVTSAPIAEKAGPGEPILQWVEDIPAGKEWMYRKGPITRLIYTRWECFPNASTPSQPIDYLVALPANRIDPAPVGLHLHCWGGSVNGGYGWWYNADKGAILIASNQIPYDWWTGYHESRNTAKTFGDGSVRPFTMDRLFSFLDFASRQWREAPEAVRPHWRKLDLSRVFTAGSSMGGSGAPMYAIRHGGRISWAISWVGVHVPEDSPQFASSYLNSYGPRNPGITMAGLPHSPWDWFSDVWWLRNHIAAETGLIIASNGKNDGAIGWPQAVAFARALQETRRPHIFNWGMGGHGTRTLTGSTLDLDIRTDQSLPAFANCSLDDNLDADPAGQFNAHLAWQIADLIDTPGQWAITLFLRPSAPKDTCTVDLTPRRLQQFKTPAGRRFRYTVAEGERQFASGTATADEHGLLTLKRIPVTKGKVRVAIAPEP